ncbi:hypothetical protein K0H71_02595 [Bacillus sp. IITD106]|nr:hypothetical protein [Bacillus sp. IITD106]
MNKKQQKNHKEEFGVELGDINAAKFYELQAGSKKHKDKKKEEKNK